MFPLAYALEFDKSQTDLDARQVEQQRAQGYELKSAVAFPWTHTDQIQVRVGKVVCNYCHEDDATPTKCDRSSELCFHLSLSRKAFVFATRRKRREGGGPCSASSLIAWFAPPSGCTSMSLLDNLGNCAKKKISVTSRTAVNGEPKKGSPPLFPEKWSCRTNGVPSVCLRQQTVIRLGEDCLSYTPATRLDFRRDIQSS
jgi:hypothetical protein